MRIPIHLSKIIIILQISMAGFSSIVLAQTKVDPNLAMTSNKGQALSAGCTQFNHPCSGQAASVPLAASTNSSNTEKPKQMDKTSKGQK